METVGMAYEAKPVHGCSRIAAMLCGEGIAGSEALACTDDLTGLPNRRFLDRSIDSLL